MGRILDITGMRRNMLVAVRELDRIKGMRCWLFFCDCGKEFPMLQAKFGVRHSCGCKHELAPGRSERNRVLRGYKENAKRRGIPWELADENFDALTRAICHYCGAPPTNTAHWGKSKGAFMYNGIDRADNEKGYTVGNSLPCCKACNFLKRTLPYEDFILLVTKIASNLGVKADAAKAH